MISVWAMGGREMDDGRNRCRRCRRRGWVDGLDWIGLDWMDTVFSMILTRSFTSTFDDPIDEKIWLALLVSTATADSSPGPAPAPAPALSAPAPGPPAPAAPPPPVLRFFWLDRSSSSFASHRFCRARGASACVWWCHSGKGRAGKGAGRGKGAIGQRGVVLLCCCGGVVLCWPSDGAIPCPPALHPPGKAISVR